MDQSGSAFFEQLSGSKIKIKIKGKGETRKAGRCDSGVAVGRLKVKTDI